MQCNTLMTVHRRIAGGAWGCCSTPKSRKFLGCRSAIFITYPYKKTHFVGNLVTAAPPLYSSTIHLCDSICRESNKNKAPIYYPYICQIYADFQNSFTVTLSRKFAIMRSLKVSPNLKCTLHYVVKY